MSSSLAPSANFRVISALRLWAGGAVEFEHTCRRFICRVALSSSKKERQMSPGKRAQYHGRAANDVDVLFDDRQRITQHGVPTDVTGSLSTQ